MTCSPTSSQLHEGGLTVHPRVVIYARYSSDNQREASIEDQVRLCREHSAAEGWELVEVFQDKALSGSTMLRPGYQALLSAAQGGGIDVVLAEALDRLSRDQEDVAGFYKRMRFAGIRIVTLAEGEISELHVGLKGTMNALYLKDLAEKTRRGLRGRIEAGRSAGGNSYGYKVIRRLNGEARLDIGAREVVASEAATVERVFRDYAAGLSPKRIAVQLNKEGVPAPRGRHWSASTINGNRTRGTGILNNELYIGRMVWNRLAYSKDPTTGKRRSRLRKTGELVVKAVPELRIISDALWEAVRARQDALEKKAPPQSASSRTASFWSKQRPRYLFSGLMRCGVCEAGFSKISANHFGCSAARNKGTAVCTNRLTIRRDALESTVLGALRERLMDPDQFNRLLKNDFRRRIGTD